MPNEESVNSIEAIDAELAKEFNLTEEVSDDNLDNEEEEVVVDDTNSKDLDSDKAELEGEETKVDEPETTEVKTVTTKEDKKEYTFNVMRADNAKLKAEKETLAKEAEFVKLLAAENGYSDVEKFKEDYRIAKLAKEAEEKGVDPVIYQKLADSDRKIAELTEEVQRERIAKTAQAFKSAVDNAVVDYSLGADGASEIYERLENAGYDVDMLLKLPNPKIIIDGVLTDKIRDITKQNQLKNIEKLDKISDAKHTGTVSGEKISLDKIIEDEMKQLKANNY